MADFDFETTFFTGTTIREHFGPGADDHPEPTEPVQENTSPFEPTSTSNTADPQPTLAGTSQPSDSSAHNQPAPVTTETQASVPRPSPQNTANVTAELSKSSSNTASSMGKGNLGSSPALTGTFVSYPSSPSVQSLTSKPGETDTPSGAISTLTASSRHHPPVAAIIGAVVGGLALIILVATILLYRRHKRRWNRSIGKNEDTTPQPSNILLIDGIQQDRKATLSQLEEPPVENQYAQSPTLAPLRYGGSIHTGYNISPRGELIHHGRLHFQLTQLDHVLSISRATCDDGIPQEDGNHNKNTMAGIPADQLTEMQTQIRQLLASTTWEQGRDYEPPPDYESQPSETDSSPGERTSISIRNTSIAVD